ncbi:MAG: TlpA family protein disulfide reductase [Sphingobacteriaceae bacterium]|nr:TlpA family protein disulfide reductase [Sphingobacteriaceae bacterium]
MKDLGNTYTVTGSPETVLFQEFNKIGAANSKQSDSLNIAFQTVMGSLKMDSLKMDSLSNIFQPVYDEIMAKFQRQLSEKIKQNVSMYASFLWLQGLDPAKNSELFQEVDKAMMKKYPNDKTVNAMHESISHELALAIGSPAPEINLDTPDGKKLALSSLKGKIVLIDFWASWCGPCRKEMPFVVSLYKKYKDKGFEIFGVSLDQDKDKWVAAIADEGITWPQVSDLRFWESEAAKLYAVTGIPYTVLLDKEGNILAKGLRGPELETAITAAIEGKTMPN